jgi:hypothetical protein
MHTLRARLAFMLCPLTAVAASLSACAPRDELSFPQALVSPYDQSAGDALWAVAPLRNESGTSSVDVLAMSDLLVAKVQETHGLACVPINRTLATMRVLGMDAVRTPSQARTLARAMGVDAIIAGSITAFDPYDPPKVGLTLGLYASGASDLAQGNRPGTSAIDPRTIASSATESGVTLAGLRPLAVVSEHFDARNHATLMDLRRYAVGRTDDRAPLGWRSYTASSELFSEFAANQAVARLIEAEQVRLAAAATSLLQAQPRRPQPTPRPR